jgi:ATP-dependent Clp protease ATP-binding subunit ClpC
MFERFTDRAREAVSLAQDEARRLGHDSIGTEHLLLGLLREGTGVAIRVLQELNEDVDTLRDDVEAAAGRGDGPPSGHIKFSEPAKTVLELSLRQALQLGHSHIGTEHLLLGMLREGDGVAARVLTGHGVTLGAAARQTALIVSSPAGRRVRAVVTGSRGAVGQILNPFGEIHDHLREISLRLSTIERMLGIERGSEDIGRESEDTAEQSGSADE